MRMGRLFWKIFFCIWLAQVLGMVGTGIAFSLEHRQREAEWAKHGHHQPPPPNMAARPDRPEPPPADAGNRPPPPPGEPGVPGEHPREHSPIPLLPALGGLFASLVSAALLAWYFAKPIGHLRAAFAAAAQGDLGVRLGPQIGSRRDELADLGRDFDQMAGQLSALMDSQRRLLHDVSHELRSPLARLLAVIGLFRQQPARAEEMLARMEREGERINLLVGELLTLSRLEAGVINQSEEVDMAELLTGIVDDARFEAEAKGRRVEFAGAAEVSVLGNGELLHRAIENIVRNAIKYTPAGSIVSIRADFDAAAGQLLIEVEDHGKGVAAEQLDSIFEPFFRAAGADGSRADSDGHGLGLAIARRVVAACGGSIGAANRPQGGLRLSLKLPASARP
jgi:signal transduction histidine kinase